MTASISDLLLVTISIPPRHIEELLDQLAELPYPINPELKYEEWRTRVIFPAYRSWLESLEAILDRAQFDGATLEHTAAAGRP